MKKCKLSVLLLSSLILLSGCVGGEESRDFVSVWCLSDEPLKEALTEYIATYNEERERGLLPVRLRSFDTEEELASGFDTMPPDILVCSLYKAELLSQQSASRDLSQLLFGLSPAYPDYIKDRLPAAGNSYLPIGGNIQLLLSAEEPESDFAALMAKAESFGGKRGLPYFTADSFAGLFYQQLLSAGKEFHALRAADIKSPLYKDTYNLLAEAAFSGGLISSDESAARLVREGYIPCAAIMSSSLSDADLEKLSVSLFEESGSLLSRLSVLSLTIRPGREDESAAGFLRWLCSERRSVRLALESGLIPAEDSTGLAASGNLEGFLLETGRQHKLHLPEGNSDFIVNYEEFEHNFRNIISFLG